MNNYFNFVYSYIVFQHIPQKFVRSYFKEIALVLDDHGLFVFQLPLIPDMMQIMEPPDTDFRRLRLYSIEEIYVLCESNRLTIVQTNYMKPTDKYPGSGWFLAKKIN